MYINYNEIFLKIKHHLTIKNIFLKGKGDRRDNRKLLPKSKRGMDSGLTRIRAVG